LTVKAAKVLINELGEVPFLNGEPALLVVAERGDERGIEDNSRSRELWNLRLYT
jgi:hypothetical protein